MSSLSSIANLSTGISPDTKEKGMLLAVDVASHLDSQHPDNWARLPYEQHQKELAYRTHIFSILDALGSGEISLNGDQPDLVGKLQLRFTYVDRLLSRLEEAENRDMVEQLESIRDSAREVLESVATT